MEKNGSPKPVFETDDRRLYFKTSFKIHPDFKESEIKDFAIGEIRTKPGRIVNQDKINILNTLKDAVPNLVRFERDKPDYVKDYAARYINSKVLKQIMKVLEVCILPNNRAAVLSVIDRANNTRNYKNYIVLLVNNGLLEMTVPKKPKSPKQKYRTTERGRRLLEMLK